MLSSVVGGQKSWAEGIVDGVYAPKTGVGDRRLQALVNGYRGWLIAESSLRLLPNSLRSLKRRRPMHVPPARARGASGSVPLASVIRVPSARGCAITRQRGAHPSGC